MNDNVILTTKIDSRVGVRITYRVTRDYEHLGLLYQPEGGRWWFISNGAQPTLFQFRTKKEALAWMAGEQA